VTLQHIRQAGATGIVTALHQIPGGQVWPIEEVQERKRFIEEAGLTWSVVESISVHEEIKYGGPNRDQLIENYKQSIRNCAALGIDTFCYNFMPVLDWSRTSLDFTFDDESLALQFDIVQFAAFELFILKRPGAVDEYNDEVKAAARRFLDTSTAEDREKLTTNLLKGLPGTTSESYSLENFQEALDVYNGIKPEQLRENLRHFLSKVVPVAEELNVMLAIHPDDPPRSLLGLPRVVSTNEDVRFILSCADSTANGLCFCVGSYGSREGNDVPEMAREHARRINFVHLRNVSATYIEVGDTTHKSVSNPTLKITNFKLARIVFNPIA
jgi:mannonate dehydratase